MKTLAEKEDVSAVNQFFCLKSMEHPWQRYAVFKQAVSGHSFHFLMLDIMK